jgi:hypothetical protein
MQNINSAFLVNNIYTNNSNSNNNNTANRTNNNNNNRHDVYNTNNLTTGQYRYQLSLLNNELDANSMNQRNNESAKLFNG